jgi:DNA adenine methylase
MDVPENKSLSPILCWTGGKTKLKHTILDHVPNDHTTYVEPFVGGGSVFFAKDRKPKMVINDKNKELVNFYRKIRDDGCHLFNTCKMPTSESKFYDVKAKGEKRSPCEFLGLVKQSYGCKLDNFNPTSRPLAKNLNCAKSCGDYEKLLKKTVILNADFADVIKKYDSKNTFFYVDPPYPNTHRYHLPELPAERVHEVLKGVKGRWILSYPNTPEIRRIFKDFHQKRVSTKYTMSIATQKANGEDIHHKEVSELMIANYDLNDPKLGNPRPRNEMSALPDVNKPYGKSGLNYTNAGAGAIIASLGLVVAMKNPRSPVGWLALGIGLMAAGA